MSQITPSTSSPSIIKDFASLITICFSMIVFQQIIAFTNRLHSSHIILIRPWQTVFLAGLLGLLICTLRREFAKQNPALIITLVGFACTISILFMGYYYKFPQYYSWLIMIMISMIALLMKRIYYLTIFMSLVTFTTIILLLLTENPGIDQGIFSVVLVMYNIII